MTDAKRFPVVGIGASAGGVAAMEGLFKGLPDKSGMAFVIVTHLSPDRESSLDEILARFTPMPVQTAADGTEIVPDHVYVMPSNGILSVKDGKLRLQPLKPAHRERKPIDLFFTSLAKEFGEYAIGIVLSGGDGDGTIGAKFIKERGGLTLAQGTDEYGPNNPDMPRSVITAGLVDIEAKAEDIGAKLVDYAASFDVLASLNENDSDEAGLLERAKSEIYAVLRSHSGHDFSGYKTKTFLRRVRRRMQVTQLRSLDAYVELLRRESSEVMSLFRDLLISVTDFFRDAEAFQLLEELVIPRLFEGKGAGDTIRVWVPGCATGEEVFSIGILMREHMATLQAPPRVQIFATDIDEAALSVARLARYPEPLLEGLSPERKRRFFNQDGASYVLSNEVRELCIFSPHSVIRDPPFSRMDMVSCRNLLIYFGPDIQNRVIPTFHYSLRPGGYLFLGTSEGIGQHGDLFAMLDKKQRIFQAREHVVSNPRFLAMVGESRRMSYTADRQDRPQQNNFPLRQAVESQVLDRFAPAHVVVNSDGDVVYYSARTGRFLEPSQGAPSRQLLTMARRGLRLELRSALREAMTTNRAVVKPDLPLDDEEGRTQLVTVTVEAIADRGTLEPLYLVLFSVSAPARIRPEGDVVSHDVESLLDLERDLRDTKERLQATIEEYETAVEELKSSNEELVSVNEEAQSTNEELEASKEEMQSLNEELNTINAELIGKVEELDRANNDLRNLFQSAQIATVFLDRNLVIRNFTPAASAFFNLRLTDIGRPLTDLTNRLDYADLKNHIEQVFATGELIEHQLPRDKDKRHYLVRLMPYREEAKTIQGVVVSLTDVTTLARAEEQQHVLISELNHRVKNMLAVVISIATSTLDGAPIHPAHAALMGRLHAMARAYGTLSHVNWTQVALKDIVRDETEHHDQSRFELSGPDVLLELQQALSLGMVIHELATNAVKYGALTTPQGKVSIIWEKQGSELHIQWQERGGPPVRQPTSTGFGLTLLEGEIGYRHGGRVDTLFEPEGLSVRISLPEMP